MLLECLRAGDLTGRSGSPGALMLRIGELRQQATSEGQGLVQALLPAGAAALVLATRARARCVRAAVACGIWTAPRAVDASARPLVVAAVARVDGAGATRAAALVAEGSQREVAHARSRARSGCAARAGLRCGP